MRVDVYYVKDLFANILNYIKASVFAKNESSQRHIWAWKALIMCSTPLNTFLGGFFEANEVAVSTRTLEFMTNPRIQLGTSHTYSDLFCWKFE